MQNPSQKFSQLISPSEIRKIVRQCQIFSLPSEIKIKIIKSYLDKRSYSLVALYKFNGQKIIGVANSDGLKRYAWRVTENIYPSFKENKKFFIPRPYCYNDFFGIFFREYQKGKNLGELLKVSQMSEKITFIKDLLNFLSTISPTNKKIIKKGIFFSDLEKNIKILNQRKGKNIREKNILEKPYSFLTTKIKKNYIQNKEKIFVHGDFNPYNILVRSSSLSLIDIEKAHWGLKEEDPANFIAHLKYSPDFDLKHKQIESWQKIIYQGLNREVLKTFEDYFGLLIASHFMVWRSDKSGLKIFKKIKFKNL